VPRSPAPSSSPERAAEEPLSAAAAPVRLAADAVTALVNEADQAAREIAGQLPE
jgi:hypothetical protein